MRCVLELVARLHRKFGRGIKSYPLGRHMGDYEPTRQRNRVSGGMDPEVRVRAQTTNHISNN